MADERSAWEDFCAALRCAALRRAGERVLRADLPDDPLLRAEGQRYLLGLVSAGVRQALELGDPARPRFLRNPDSASRWGAENADNQYLWARIAPDACYRLGGQRNSSFDFLIEVKQGYMQLGDAANYATLSAREIVLAPDGSFEIVLGGAPRPRNWLPLDPGARYLCIRQFFYDWENEIPARFSIALDGEQPGAEGAARTLLEDAATWVETSAAFWSDWVAELRRAGRYNSPGPARKFVGGADEIYYGNELYRLAQDEVLLVESELPDARYWSFQLCDLWFRSQDYANRQTSLNGHQARIDSDGRFRCVLAHCDPGVPNWLDTAGHREGMLQYRWVWTRSNPAPRARLLPLAELRVALPADTPTVSPEQRRQTIRIRQRHVARREPAS